jgi:hypothetical protein
MLTNEDERISTKAIKAKTGSFRFFTQSIEAYSKSGNIKAYRKKKGKGIGCLWVEIYFG